MGNINVPNISTLGIRIWSRISPLLKTIMQSTGRQYERTFTTQGAIVLSSVPLLTFMAIIAYKRYYMNDDSLTSLVKEINGKTIYKELDENPTVPTCYPAKLQLPTLSNSLGEFKVAILGEVED